MEILKSLKKEAGKKNLVEYYDSFLTDADGKAMCIVMEYCANGDLAGLLKKKTRLEEDLAILYGFQLAEALEFLHENKILHRDLKPRNVFLKNNYEGIALGDFGV